MINKKDLKIGALAGITGFVLAFLFVYFTAGFEWRFLEFPAVIGIGCFGGGFLGSMLRRLNKAGEGRKATMIVLIGISFLIIALIYPSLLEQGIGPPWWRWVFTAVFVIYWFRLLVEIFKKR